MIIELLQRIKNKLENDKDLLNLVSSGEDFELYVHNKITEILKAGQFELYKVIHNGKHAFPDLSLVDTQNNINYGLEIKYSGSGNWSSKGNSVFETYSNKATETGYAEIYVLFGRRPKPKENMYTCEVEIKPYGNCIDKIEVTHSPRFSINMNIGDNNLFNILEYPEGYAAFRTTENSDKNEFLRRYFNSITSTNEADKWYITTNNGSDKLENESSPEISIQAIPFTSLSLEQKRQIIAEAFILFPKDLFKDRADYSNLIKYMISKHFVYSASLRDLFSSGGKTYIVNKEKKYPQMIKTFYDHRVVINNILSNPRDDFEKDCFLYWESSDFNFDKENSLSINYKNIIESFLPVMTVEIHQSNSEPKEIKEHIELYNFIKI